MKTNYIKYIQYSVIPIIILTAIISSSVSAQVNTLYFMKTVSTRHELNPSFQPVTNGYYSTIPVFSGFSTEIGNNSISLENILYPKNVDGKYKTIWFFHEKGNIGDFYKNLKTTAQIYTEVDLRLFALGFKMQNNSYLTIGLNTKSSTGVFVPKDLAKLLVYGTLEKDKVNSFNLDRFGVRENLYTELAVGYSRAIDKKLTVGGKLKLLAGHANATTEITKFRLDASRDKWNFDIRGTVNASVPNVTYDLDEQNKIETVNTDRIIDDLKFGNLLAGFGLAFDLGANYKLLNDRLTVSASLLDFGFIGWNAKNAVNIPVDEQFEFDGIEIEIKDGTANWDEDYFDNVLNDINYSTSFNSYMSALAAKILIGAEYEILDNYLTLGALSKSTIINRSVFQEITASVNYLQFDYFNVSLSYSLLSGRFSTFGLGLGGRIGPVNIYLASDYLPAHYTKQFIPYKSKAFNLQMGILFNWGYSSKKNADDDNDGIQNRKDKCPDTPMDAFVDKSGCPLEDNVEN